MDKQVSLGVNVNTKFTNNDGIKLTLGGYSPIQYRLMNQQMI
ncbi:hypothetical protein [Hujiaoplasma nucleasis]|nr:hypothetical protein [Hujiaoplasma nucleasis]